MCSDDDACGLVGTLSRMCSSAEAEERQETRQLDRLECKAGTDSRHPKVDPELATKKYRRSAAGREYRAADIRSPDACWQTMAFLMSEVLELDVRPQLSKFAQTPGSYSEVYAYLRDRTRAVRADLHLQQPGVSSTPEFLRSHECCLRFELLSRFLLIGTEGYDEKLGTEAISQTIGPLMAAYRDSHQSGFERSASEPAIRHLMLLLLLTFSPGTLSEHLAALDKSLLRHPLIRSALGACSALQAGDCARFLKYYRAADFLSAVAMSGAADLARLRVLWMLARCSPPGIGDRLRLARVTQMLACGSEEHARQFLELHGVQVDGTGSDSLVVLPKRGGPQGASEHPLLAGGPGASMPERCLFPRGEDDLLAAKFAALGVSRAKIVFGD
eukprot:CAMPEP_0204148994 /NCGR_PEP_ID=MMETSP0361-20130328/24025_1 /ASSEMBLY_ACC=CAM_ASM_000343 /TAXON_ID=268821 /ORGANISM="Scrippsiella Hangoei, Strain SHTV-5" /LENGTH=386 /DNA_ID=CAMNT_0051103433 /DNA_START=47 /DNA_END=1204 /DNA_ORIENTATION=+